MAIIDGKKISAKTREQISLWIPKNCWKKRGSGGGWQ